MKALFAGQKVWLWFGLDASCQERIWNVLHHNGAVLQDGDWTQEAHGDGEFLVVDNVERSEIHELGAKGGTIVGVECINQSVEQRLPLPKLGRILCCRALEGHKICLTGFTDNERTKLSSKIFAMGGECTNTFDGTITNIVSKAVYNDKCKMAVKMKKPVVTTAWVERCWAKHEALPEEDFRLPVLSNTTICCTSLKNPEKEKVMELTAEHGGKYSAEFHNQCTHLICGSTGSKKYQMAMRWRKHVVTPEWLYKSIDEKGCLEETLFAPAPPEDDALPGSLRSASQTSFGQTARLASGTQGSLTLTRVQATPTDDESFGRAESGKHATTAGRESAYEMDDADKLFLSSCRLYFGGMSKEENKEALQMMRASGATRYAQLDDRATHVVLGDCPDCDLTEVRKLEAAGIVEVVWLSWLRACLQYRKLLPVVEKHRVPRDQLAANRVAAKPKPLGAPRPVQKQGLVPVPASRLQGGPVPNVDDEDSPNEPGSNEWEKLKESQRQVTQRPTEGSGDGSRGGLGEGLESRGALGEGLGEVGDEPPVLEMRSDILDDASRTGFGPSAHFAKPKPGADVSARMPVLGKRFMSPKRASSSQKEAVASPKLAAAFPSESARSGGVAKKVMGPPSGVGKWTWAAKNPVKANPVLNPENNPEEARLSPDMDDPGLKASGGDDQVKGNGVSTSKRNQSEPAGSSGLKSGSKTEPSLRSWARFGSGTQSQQAPGGSQLPDSSDVFHGLRFHIDVSIDDVELEHTMALVSSGAGEIEPSPSKRVDYLIVLHGFDTATVKVASGTEIVTPFWLVQCLRENRLIPLDDRLYFRPLPHPVPFACFKSVVICQSNYNDAERENLKRVTMCLGGKVRERLNSTVTHLVAKFAVGEKYQAMLKMGKPVVTGEWLYACAHQGFLVSVQDFAPPMKPADVVCAPSQAGGVQFSQQEPRSPGEAGDDSRRQSSMPPPRTRGPGRSSQSSQQASQPQRKRAKKDSPKVRPGDFEHLDDLAATWTGSQAPSPPTQGAKAQLNLRAQLEIGRTKAEPVSAGVNTQSEGVKAGVGLNARSGGVKSPLEREPVVPAVLGRGGGGFGRGTEPGGAKRAPSHKLDAALEIPPENGRNYRGSKAGFEKDGFGGEEQSRQGGATVLGSKRELKDETPSKNTRSRRSVPSEPKAGPHSKGKRKSEERGLPQEKGSASEAVGGEGVKRQKSEGPSSMEGGHVAREQNGHVVEEGVSGERRGDKDRNANAVGVEKTTSKQKGGEQAGNPDGGPGIVEGLGDPGLGNHEGDGAGASEEGCGQEGAQESPEDDMFAKVIGFFDKLPSSNQSSAPAEGKHEGGLGGSESKRPRVNKVWPPKEPAVLAPKVPDGPWTRRRTAVAPAVAEEGCFQESQMESQMVGYDDGAARGQELIDKFQRSKRAGSSLAASSARGGMKPPQAKDKSLRNLIETANGNK